MDNTILDIALNDFNMDSKMYNSMSKNDIKSFTNVIIDNREKKSYLQFSQQILLDCKKKSVSFCKNLFDDSPEFRRVINNEKIKQQKHKTKQKSLEFSGYEIPMVEYINTYIKNSQKT